MRPAHLMFLSATVLGAMGLTHLVWTFRGRAFHPRDAEVRRAMERTTLFLSAETTMWNAWIGFNGSHGIGALLFSVIFGYLALAHTTLLFQSPFLLAVGGTTLLALLVLARRYWFAGPQRGIAFSLLCYVGSVLWSVAA
jgi:hypothetical protein